MNPGVAYILESLGGRVKKPKMQDEIIISAAIRELILELKWNLLVSSDNVY